MLRASPPPGRSGPPAGSGVPPARWRCSWSALATAAALADDGPARWLVAAGWLGHAIWDVVHHRRGRVVPRGDAEWCAVLDTVVGITTVLAILG